MTGESASTAVVGCVMCAVNCLAMVLDVNAGGLRIVPRCPTCSTSPAFTRSQLRDLVRGMWLELSIDDPTSLVRGRIRAGSSPRACVQARSVWRPIGTTWAWPLVMSARFRDVLTSLGMTGWNSVPVDLDPPLAEQLWLLTVTGRCGPAYRNSGLRYRGMPALGTFLDPGQWDGSDVFMPDDLQAVLLAPSRVSELKRVRFRNVSIEPASLEPRAG